MVAIGIAPAHDPGVAGVKEAVCAAGMAFPAKSSMLCARSVYGVPAVRLVASVSVAVDPETATDEIAIGLDGDAVGNTV